MNHHYLLAIGAGLSLVLCSISAASAQTELPTRPAMPYVAPTVPPAALAGTYPANAIGVELGWGGPYGGIGVHYARMVTRNVDVNAGLGFGLGGKLGVGVRYYFRPDRPVSGYFGANLSRTGRITEVDWELNQEKANYSIAPSGVLHLRGGMRWQPGKVGLLGTIGYGVRFTGDPVTFNNTAFYGQPSQQMRDAVSIITSGGIEFSLGVVFGFGD